MHIGYIMDGNRRWAKKLANIASFGHEKGSDSIEGIIRTNKEKGVEYVTFWALSKENITERDRSEIATIYGLIEHKLPKFLPMFHEEKIRLEIIGDMWLLPEKIRNILFAAMEETASYSDMTVIFAVGYSGQDEMVRAVKRAIAEGVDPRTLDEKNFREFLDSGRFPGVDLIVRTGGNIRHSGFYLYDSAYAEYHFTETLWPDFSSDECARIIDDFAARTRNFGK